MPVTAVILAAGEGSRFAGPSHKLLAPFGAGGRTVLGASVEVAIDSGIGEVVVVEGAVPLSDEVPESVHLVRNEDWTNGLASSLHVGVEFSRGMQVDAVVVGLGDQPLISPSAWRAVAGSSSPIARACYPDRFGQPRRFGHPVRLGKSVWLQLPTSGETGARLVMQLKRDLVEEVPCEGDPEDIDTVEDLQKWN